MVRANFFGGTSFYLKLCITFCLCVFFCSPMHGQNGFALNTGIPVQSTQYPIRLGSVNLDSGNLFLKIPLLSFAERSGPPAQVNLIYNSTFWDIWQGAPPDGGWAWYPFPLGQGGLSLDIDYGTESNVLFQTAPNPCNQYGYLDGGGQTYSNFYLTDANGTKITFSQIPPISYMIFRLRK
jgi:hypothetical protein